MNDYPLEQRLELDCPTCKKATTHKFLGLDGVYWRKKAIYECACGNIQTVKMKFPDPHDRYEGDDVRLIT